MRVGLAVSVAAAAIFAVRGALCITVPVMTGGSEQFWERCAVLVAQVEVPPSLPANEAVLRPIGTLSGQFDSSRFSDVLAMVGFGETRIYRAVYPRAKGQLVLATIYRAYWLPRVDYVVEGQMAFIRDSREPMEVVDGFADPQIDATLKAIQHARRHEVPDYWATHRVVFAEVMGVTGPNRAEKRSTILLRLMLTLGGELDPGKTPEVAASAGPKGFGPPRAPAVGNKVLAVLERRGDFLSCCRRFPDVHAGGRRPRTPICVVNGFADPKVGKAIIELHDLATRTGHETPEFGLDRPGTAAPPQTASPAKFWETGSVALAEIISPRRRRRSTSFFARWEPSAATLDASRIRRLPADLPLLWAGTGPHVFPRVSGRLLLMALCKGTDGYALASGKLPFMRDSRESIEVVKGFSDPQVEATLKAIQEVRNGEKPAYWSQPCGGVGGG